MTQSLLRRYRHEGRSEEAYRLSGAIFEAKQQVFSGHGDISLAAHSMAAFGFDRQALALLGTAPNVERRGLPYDLAWKAGKWDLPLPAGGELRDGPTAIYTVLRSLQQDRDFQHSQSLLDNALVHQATRLFNISDSSPVPDKVATSALLTLFTVQQLQPSHSSPLAPNDLSGLP